MPKLSTQQARRIADAEARVTAAKDELAAAKAEREKLRERYDERVPVGSPIIAGGFRILRREQTSGPSFRIGKFLEKHRLTKSMQPFFREGTEFEVWDVKPASNGATRSGSRS